MKLSNKLIKLSIISLVTVIMITAIRSQTQATYEPESRFGGVLDSFFSTETKPAKELAKVEESDQIRENPSQSAEILSSNPPSATVSGNLTVKGKAYFLGNMATRNTTVTGNFSQGGSLFIRDGGKIDNLTGNLSLQQGSLVISKQGTVSAKKKVKIENKDLSREELEEIKQYEATSSAAATRINTNDSTNKHESENEISRGLAQGISVNLRRSYEKVRRVFEVRVAEKVVAYLDNTGRFFARVIGSPKVETDVVAPLKNEDLAIKLGSKRTQMEQTKSKFKITNNENQEVAAIDESGTATLNKLRINENPLNLRESSPKSADILFLSIGSSNIESDKTSALIRTKKVTENSKVFVTPTTPTDNQQLYISQKVAGKYFVVSVEEKTKEEIKFNWWIIN
ncbi:MAG: hypothetical protein ACOC4Z_03245 [Patescibacteria group bacterium]